MLLKLISKCFMKNNRIDSFIRAHTRSVRPSFPNTHARLEDLSSPIGPLDSSAAVARPLAGFPPSACTYCILSASNSTSSNMTWITFTSTSFSSSTVTSCNSFCLPLLDFLVLGVLGAGLRLSAVEMPRGSHSQRQHQRSILQQILL